MSWAEYIIRRFQELGRELSPSQQESARWMQAHKDPMQAIDHALMEWQRDTRSAFTLPAEAAEWSLIEHEHRPSSGYDGLVLKHKETGEIVLMHGSTNGLVDLLQGSLGHLSETGLDAQVEHALAFTQRVTSGKKACVEAGAPVRHYGFSLGGVLAQVSAAVTIAQKRPSPVCTVDGTGLNPVLEHLVHEGMISGADKLVQHLHEQHFYMTPSPINAVGCLGISPGAGVAFPTAMREDYLTEAPKPGRLGGLIFNQTIQTLTSARGVVGAVISSLGGGKVTGFIQQHVRQINHMLAGFTDYTLDSHLTQWQTPLREEMSRQWNEQPDLLQPVTLRLASQEMPKTSQALQKVEIKSLSDLRACERVAIGADDSLQRLPHRLDLAYKEFLNQMEKFCELRHAEAADSPKAAQWSAHLEHIREFKQLAAAGFSHQQLIDDVAAPLAKMIKAIHSNPLTSAFSDMFIGALAQRTTQDWLEQQVRHCNSCH